MNNLQKTLFALSTICILVLCYFLFIIKYDRYASCVITEIEKIKYLVIKANDYHKLENKKNVNISNKTHSYEIKTKNSWSYIKDSEMWITALESYIKTENGNYTIYLTKQTIWAI